MVYLNLPHLHFGPPLGMTPFEFCGDLWRQKPQDTPGNHVALCVILGLAVLIQYWAQHTHTHLSLIHI